MAAMAMSIQVFESCGTSTPVVVVVVLLEWVSTDPLDDPLDGAVDAVDTEPLPEDDAPPLAPP